MSFEKYLEENALKTNKKIEKYVPRIFSKDALLFKLIKPRYALNLEPLNKAIADPIWEFLDRGGKRWRPSLFLLITEALGKEPGDFIDFSVIPELIHNGTLMVDDIEDSSECRRGKPCTYKLFGLDIAINAGNAMYYLPLLSLIDNKKKIEPERLARVYEMYTEEMIKLSLGQAMDIVWHRGLANADETTAEDYMQMCAYKTGTLARMSAKLAAVLSGADEELTEKLGIFAESLGIAFQMKDDVLDLASSKFTEKKGGRGQDITEGKRSLPVIRTLAVSSVKDKERLIEILNMHTPDEQLKDEAIAIMQKYGSIDYTKRFANEIVEKSWKETDALLPDSKAKERLKAFAEYLTERKI